MHRSTPKSLSSSRRLCRGAAVVLVATIAACGGRAPPPKPPAPSPPPADPPVLAQIARACARLSACTRSNEAHLRDPGACVDWWLAGADPTSPDPLRACLAEAATCEHVSACMRGGGDARAAAFCARRAGVVSGCDGDRLVSCADEEGHASNVVDCGAMGATCREVKTAGVVVRGCWSPKECPPGAPETRCDGARAVLSCRDGALDRAACPPGTRCEERRDASGEAVAVCALPGGLQCGAGGLRRCVEDRFVECDRAGAARAREEHASGGVRVTDCAGFGLRCAGAGPRAGCFVPASVECERELLPRCDGGSLVFCAAGRLERLSCAGIGLGRCDPSAKGSIAGCTPPDTAGAAGRPGSGPGAASAP